MQSDLRFVFDTNVLVSALLLRRSVARQSLDKALQYGKLLVSRDTVEELNSVLGERASRFTSPKKSAWSSSARLFGTESGLK